ncbi:hypothetical protein CV093_09630 [Oceanobacillus sp. 143]|nr:hypothetical protein CV093_09630 [Oceanobacillus sp. 143]
MSKSDQSQTSNRRIIEIKPIELRREEQQNEQLIEEKDVITLNEQVEKAKAELAEFEKRKGSLLEATKAEIEQEKVNGNRKIKLDRICKKRRIFCRV